MLREEFEQRTGFYPTSDLFTVIEEFYIDFNGDKDAFCKAYKSNTDGLAEKIQFKADMRKIKSVDESNRAVKALEEEMKRLKDALEREQEWKPYVDEHNVQQDRYENLRNSGSTQELSDAEAIDLLNKWFGFDKDRIKIVRTLPQYEVNRHRRLRKVGEIDRKPLYNATDWNYICFNCGMMGYELFNGELRFYIH